MFSTKLSDLLYKATQVTDNAESPRLRFGTYLQIILYYYGLYILNNIMASLTITSVTSSWRPNWNSGFLQQFCDKFDQITPVDIPNWTSCLELLNQFEAQL